MTFGRYAVIVLAVAAVTLTALVPRIEPAARSATMVGAGLAVANTLVAYALIRWASPRSTNAFMGAVLGGMVGRMGLMLGAVLVALLGLRLPSVPLVVSLLSYFVLFLALELTVLSRRSRPGADAQSRQA